MAEYPSEYELDVALRDGGGARIRPIKPGDGPLLVEFFERLGPESRYFRFFRIKETLEPKEVEFFTNVDYSDRMALVRGPRRQDDRASRLGPRAGRERDR